MKVEWDYTNLARPYLKRPDYSKEALLKMFSVAKINKGDFVCDVGAGVAHLTIPLLEAGFTVTAVEPNDAMRELGIERTKPWSSVKWIEGTGEQTKQENDAFKLVSFGSSFNVTNRQEALKESARILKRDGFFSCMWNLRDFNDPIQSEIEKIIKSYASEYDYGSRREDQTDVITKSNLFHKPEYIEGTVNHVVNTNEWVQAWKSHATLSRQVGDKLDEVVNEISKVVANQSESFSVPYVTKIWIAQKTN